MLEAAAAAVQENLISAYLMSSSTSRAAKTMSQITRSVCSACSAAQEQPTKTAPSHSEWTSMLCFLPRPAVSQARGHSANFFEIDRVQTRTRRQYNVRFCCSDFEEGGKHFITDTLWKMFFRVRAFVLNYVSLKQFFNVVDLLCAYIKINLRTTRFQFDW